MSHRPPKNDKERLENLLQALSRPGDEDDALDEQIQEELARRGLTLDTWATQIQAQAQAVLDRNHRPRRMPEAKLATAGAAGLAAPADVALALRPVEGPTADPGDPRARTARHR